MEIFRPACQSSVYQVFSVIWPMFCVSGFFFRFDHNTYSEWLNSNKAVKIAIISNYFMFLCHITERISGP